MMTPFFDYLLKNEISSSMRSAVVLKGEDVGKRALYADGALLYSECAALSDQGILPDGQQTGLIRTDDRLIFFEEMSSRPRLVIYGGGHVAEEVLKVAHYIGFSVTLAEDREYFADLAGKNGADRVLFGSYEDALLETAGDPDTYYILLTRGQEIDMICLRTLLRGPFAYIGMLGSRKRAANLKNKLLAEGISEEIFDLLHAPVGLDIGAETPEEIAVAVLAELIKEKRLRRRAEGFSEEILETIRDNERCVLATIVERKGTAPRQPGTKMVVLADGTTVGTVGGGLTENTARLRGVEMLKQTGKSYELFCRDSFGNIRRGDETDCAGLVTVFLETL